MRILIVNSCNSAKDSFDYVFVNDQADALKNLGYIVDFFGIKGSGILGYLSNRKKLLDKISEFHPDIIHAHYGLSGLLANLQRRVPVITTYIGSDINNNNIFFISQIVMVLSAQNIFVSKKIKNKSLLKSNQTLLPYGIDLNLFIPTEKIIARNILGLDIDKNLILFAGSFDNPVKNSVLAKTAITAIPNVELLRMGGGYTREQVALLFNAVDVALMTSFSEGSPQFIKEAMACNCPIVSVPVGDVFEMIDSLNGCYISTYNPSDVTDKIIEALKFKTRTNGRNRIISLGLDNENVARKLSDIYIEVKKHIH